MNSKAVAGTRYFRPKLVDEVHPVVNNIATNEKKNEREINANNSSSKLYSLIKLNNDNSANGEYRKSPILGEMKRSIAVNLD